jgi:hypothetical protein
MPAQMTPTAWGQGLKNALIAGLALFVVGCIITAPAVLIFKQPILRSCSISGTTLFGLVLLVALGTWLYARSAAGPVLLDCGPHPMRNLFLLNAPPRTGTLMSRSTWRLRKVRTNGRLLNFFWPDSPGGIRQPVPSCVPEAVRMRLKLVAPLTANQGEGRLHLTVILGFSIKQPQGLRPVATRPRRDGLSAVRRKSQGDFVRVIGGVLRARSLQSAWPLRDHCSAWSGRHGGGVPRPRYASRP